MKKIKYWIMVFMFIMGSTSCTSQSSQTHMTIQEIGKAIVDSQEELPELKQLTKDENELNTFLSDNYHIINEQINDGIIYYAEGVEATEIAVLKLFDEKNIKEIENILKEYMQDRANIFEGYAPQQAALIKKGMIVDNGQYIALLICSDTSKAKSAFLDCFKNNQENDSDNNTQLSSSDENDKKTDIYDSSVVLKAWQNGNTSALSKTDLDIFNAAKKVIQNEINDHMNNYEKELAIHDWITNWSDFDYSVFSRSSDESIKKGSDTPYGVLIHKEGMCHGYSSTFQLFMDMLDIECITVFGIANSNGIKHSWNMVKLDGEWYCVDVAWDDPIGASPIHTYFNVTSKYLKESGIHQWNEKDVPEATATTYSYKAD